MFQRKIMQVLLLLVLGLILIAAQHAPAGTVVPSSECRRKCGDIDIPYPFGIDDPSCSLAEGFEISCRLQQNGEYKPFRASFEVLNISLIHGTARVLNYIMGYCYNTSTGRMDDFGHYKGEDENNQSSPYRFSDVHNKFTVIGCNALASIDDDYTGYHGLGVATCRDPSDLADGVCSGIGCSQSTIPKRMYHYATTFFSLVNTSRVRRFNRCSYAVLMEATAFNFSTSYISNTVFNDTYGGWAPMVVDWAIRDVKSCDVAQSSNNTSNYACLSSNSVCIDSLNDDGYICNCFQGYEGNPYLPRGCQDVNECSNNPCPSGGVCHNIVGGFRCSCRVGRKLEGNTCNLDTRLIIGLAVLSVLVVIIITIIVSRVQMVIQKKKLNTVKQEYFRRHGGVILLDQMKMQEGLGFIVFSEAELINATSNYDDSRILGKGGNGTVYKGITDNNMEVAVKRSGLVEERQKKEFGKEMLILSQLNHKNIVKLVGCCLEVEVPILVYEFVLNGTLFELIHGNNKALQISFGTLLRIAHEAAEGLRFLHSDASPPVIHGDVKTSNILLDENYMAKVSDFGASILAPSDKDQFITKVQGTWGYLDPECIQTFILTNKSDVYSFGVILLEILTGQLPMKLEGPEKQICLSSVFLSGMKEDNLDAMLVSQVKGQESMELLRGLAELATKCLDMCGVNRPSMKEVADELGRLRKLSWHPWEPLNVETGAGRPLGGESTSGYETEFSSYPMGDRENQPINPRSSYYAE